MFKNMKNAHACSKIWQSQADLWEYCKNTAVTLIGLGMQLGEQSVCLHVVWFPRNTQKPVNQTLSLGVRIQVNSRKLLYYWLDWGPRLRSWVKAQC